jgi:serine/threonine-protein kinase
MKAGFLKTDWFLGLVIFLFMFFAGRSDLLQSLERKAYDMGVQATARTASDKIAVIAIDDTSLANIGRWPWSREVLAAMTDKLSAAKAKVIAYGVLFSEPQVDPGYQYVTKLIELVNAQPGGDATPIGTLLKEAEQKLKERLNK